MKKLVLSLLSFLVIGSMSMLAQDTLPEFSVKNVGNKRIIIGWTNTFESIKQVSIQRSFDSLKGFSTILTVPDATAPQNGYVDTKASNDHMFYRLYIMLDKGVYFFSRSRRPELDTVKIIASLEKVPTVNLDSISVPNFETSNGKTKPQPFVPSMHVYTSKDGYVRVSLPDEPGKKYDIKFYDSDDNFLFELKNIKERTFKLDKTSFFHAGWFKFELFENDELTEKHKFYLQKDF